MPRAAPHRALRPLRPTENETVLPRITRYSRWSRNAHWVFRMLVDNLGGMDETTSLGGSGEPVLLLHGWGGSPRMLRPLARYLRRTLGRPTLDLALGVGLGDIRDSAIRAHRLLEERGVERCDVVGYSMGGLVAAYLLKCLDHGQRIRSVVTLGTPHRGVPLASRGLALLFAWCRSAVQMRRGSPLLDQLRRLPPPPGTHMLSLAGSDDAIVPPAVARLEGPGCRSLLVNGVDHFGLLTSRQVFRCVAEDLRPASVHRLPATAVAGGVALELTDARSERLLPPGL